MLNRFIFIFIIILSMFFNSCATFITVKVLKPAEFNISSTKKVLVTDFTFKGNWDFNETTTLKDIAAEIISHAIFGTKPEEFDQFNAYPGKDISDKFTSKLMVNGHFKVLRRDQSGRGSGRIFSDTDAARVGETLGVNLVIVGSGNYLIKDSGQWFEDIIVKNNIKRRHRKYKISRSVNTEITYRVIDVASAKVVASKTNYDEEYFTTEGENEDSAKSKIDDWKIILDNQVNYLLERSVKQIAPHYVYEEREIKNGSSQLMKDSVEYAKRDLWEDSRKAWEYIINDYSFSWEDKLFANYNLGIYHEMNGDYEEAEKLFDLCFNRSGKSEYLEAKSRVQKRKLEVKKLMLQK